jgi:hypothetical protein
MEALLSDGKDGAVLQVYRSQRTQISIDRRLSQILISKVFYCGGGRQLDSTGRQDCYHTYMEDDKREVVMPAG